MLVMLLRFRITRIWPYGELSIHEIVVRSMIAAIVSISAISTSTVNALEQWSVLIHLEDLICLGLTRKLAGRITYIFSLRRHLSQNASPEERLGACNPDRNAGKRSRSPEKRSCPINHFASTATAKSSGDRPSSPSTGSVPEMRTNPRNR
jgi:hypothetical protein